MTGGLIQLVAYGVQDIFLTRNPEITFFKTVYRRHTNFSVEPIPQYFSSEPGFGKKVSATITKAGDLANKMYLALTLKRIDEYITTDTNEYYISWVRRLGFALIKYVEIEIGGQLIDRQYGEWMNIWYELTHPNSKERGTNNMIGNTLPLTNISKSKEAHRLYIPFQFWFCRFTGLSLPLISLTYSEVKINLQFNTADKCYTSHPTNYILIEDDIVPFTRGDYIEQTINGKKALGIFIYFDKITRKLYYTNISTNKFQGTTSTSTTVQEEFKIKNQKNSYEVLPLADEKNNRIPREWLRKVDIENCFLLVDYIYLDSDERVKFAKAKHEYLIEQIQHDGEVLTNNMYNETIKLGYDHPCKSLAWVSQLVQMEKNNDWFNYTDDPRHIDDEYPGNPLINEETVLINGHELVSKRSWRYFNHTQPLKNYLRNPSTGINVYSYALFPMSSQPSGTCNLGVVSDINLTCTFFRNSERMKIRTYAVVNNILRINNGMGGLVFSK